MSMQNIKLRRNNEKKYTQAGIKLNNLNILVD